MRASEKRRLFSIPEAGVELGGQGRCKIYTMIADGRLTRVKIGRRSAITAESIDAEIDRAIAEAATHEDARA